MMLHLLKDNCFKYALIVKLGFLKEIREDNTINSVDFRIMFCICVSVGWGFIELV